MFWDIMPADAIGSQEFLITLDDRDGGTATQLVPFDVCSCQLVNPSAPSICAP